MTNEHYLKATKLIDKILANHKLSDLIKSRLNTLKGFIEQEYQQSVELYHELDAVKIERAELLDINKHIAKVSHESIKANEELRNRIAILRRAAAHLNDIAGIALKGLEND